MSKQYTPSETRRKLKNFIFNLRTSLFEVRVKFLRIPPFFNIVFSQYCQMLGLVLPSRSVPQALTVRVTLATSLYCVSKKTRTQNFIMKG